MNKILSWKIKTGVYAYIFIPNSNSYISKRITEDSPLWETIIGTIKEWKIDKYREHFDKMALEVLQRYGKIIPWNESYFNYRDNTSIDGVNIIMLSGEGDGSGGNGSGSGVGGDADNGVDGGNGSSSSALDKFKDDIQDKLDAVTAAVNAKNTEVMAFVEKQVSQTVADAKNTINETVEALCAKTESAIVQLNNASDAIDKAAALFEMGEGGITAEKLQEALTTVSGYGGWMSTYSGNVIEMWSDYDAANKTIGSVGEAVDGKKGLFTRIGTHIDTINETVGNVQETADASRGLAETLASWVNESAGTVANARSWLDASAATIGQTIDFIDVDNQNSTSLSRVMDALSGEIIDTAMKMDESGITNVTREMNAGMGLIRDEITNLSNGVNGRLRSLGQEMNAMSASMTTWITDEYSGTVKDLRDSWDTISGMVRSVSDLIIKSDEKGPIAYLLEGYNDGVRARVYKPEYIGKTSSYPWINLTNTTGYSDTEVVGEYTTEMMSYISQEANRVMMSVVDGTGLTAAIVANIEGEGDAKNAVVGVVADEMIINANTIIKAMSAKTASIGGIQIGEGKIKSVEEVNEYGVKIGSNDAFVLDGITGGFSATNAYIEGKIKATEGELEKVIIKGSTQSPFIEFSTIIETDTNKQYDRLADNYLSSTFVEKTTASQVITLPNSIEESDGRRITLVGNFHVNSKGPTTFYENGRESENIDVYYEVVELLGFSVPKNDNSYDRIFKGWIVLNRQRINGNYPHGKNVSAMAFGSFKSNGTLKSKTFDEKKLTGKRTGIGIYEISIPKEWCASLDELIVSCSIVHNSGGFSAISIVARKDAENNSIHFGTYNGTGGPCDSDFEFIIYSMNIWNSY